MSDHDISYVSLNVSKQSDEDERRDNCAKTTEQLSAAYSMIPDLKVLKPFSPNESRDIEAVLKGDYQNYHKRRHDVLLLPDYRFFQERLENSPFDKLNIESPALNYRFLAPFLMKAELSPGLAFSEALLTLIHMITFTSVFTSGLTGITIFIGGCSTFLLLSVIHFWYGLSRYPSIWNRFVSAGLKGSTIDRNFKEINEICGYYHNGHFRTNSQVIPFALTLPFTILFHANAFLVTATFHLLKILKIEKFTGGKLPDPVITSIFISNALLAAFWFLGGTGGIIFSTLTIFFNQKAFNSLLFKKNLKDFFVSLIFGNFLVVGQKVTSSVIEVGLSQKAAAFDVEEGVQKSNFVPKIDEGVQYSPEALPPVRYLPPLLGVSTSSASNSIIDEEMATPEIYSSAGAQSYSSMIHDKIIVTQHGEEQVASVDEVESPIDIFVDETSSQHTKDALQHEVTSQATSRRFEEIINDLQNDEKHGQVEEIDIETTVERGEPTRKHPKNSLRDLSHRIFSSTRNKYNQSKQSEAQKQDDNDDILSEFLNPIDVHLDMENHPGTSEWRFTITESIQKFKINTYTLRKHNWVMSQMHGRSFYIRENGGRRRKLKKKEIKEYCKRFHDKQVHMNSQIFSILDDLKDLKKNISHSKSNSVSHKSHSEHSKFSFTNLPSTGKEIRKQKQLYTMAHAEYQAPKHDAASIAKQSRADSKDSSLSTLTQSVIYFDQQQDDNITGINEDSSAFKGTINGLLKCTDWIQNIDALKQNASKEGNSGERNDSISARNTTAAGGMLKCDEQAQCEALRNHSESLKIFCGDDNYAVAEKSRPSDRIAENSETMANVKKSSVDGPEIDKSLYHSVHKKISNIDFGGECSALDGMVDTCSQLTTAEQREDEHSLSDNRVICTERVL